MACTEYGPTESGFVRKPFNDILNDLWAKAQANDANLVRSDTTVAGQWLSLFADCLNDQWQLAEGIDDGCDLSKAEGCRLDRLAQLVGFTRRDDEDDDAFRTRLLGFTDTTNQTGNTVLNNLITNVYGVTGVTCVDVTVNETSNTVDDLPPHSYEVIVQGGDDEDVAEVIWSSHPVGITLHGNTSVDIDTPLSCQAVNFSRPTEVQVCLDVVLKATRSDCGCSESDAQVIKDTLLEFFTEDCPSCRFGVGDDVIYNSMFEPFYTQFNGFIVTSLLINSATDDIEIGTDEIAVVDCDCLNISFE